MLSDLPPWVFPAAFASIVALMLYRLWYGARVLKAQGRVVRPKLPTDALFGESGASGHSTRSLITRLGGARNVLFVWVTKREFVVEAIFPFNVVMYENPYDLEHRVPIEALTGAELVDNGLVAVSFNDSKQQPHTLRLLLKNPDALLSALKSLGVANISPERARDA